MESLKLTFDAQILRESKKLIVEVPYQEGMVATSKFCPTELLAGDVNLMAAVRGESLDSFMVNCRRQLTAMGKITEVSSDLDCHIGALMAVVMDHLSRVGNISFEALLTYMDCFSLLLEADGFSDEEIREIYPGVVKSITDLYPDNIEYKK